MNIDLLNIENDKAIIGLECYTVPELKAIMDRYDREVAIEIFTYFHLFYHPKSPYKNNPEKEREEIIINATRTLDWDEEDEEILRAKVLLTKLFISPTRQIFLDSKASLERIGRFMRETPITGGKDGTFSTMSINLTRIGKIMQDFKLLEKMVEDEEALQIRGGGDLSYDQK